MIATVDSSRGELSWMLFRTRPRQVASGPLAAKTRTVMRPALLVEIVPRKRLVRVEENATGRPPHSS